MLRQSRTYGAAHARLRFASDDQRAIRIIAGFRAMVFDAVLPMRAEMVKAEAIVLGIDEGEKPVAASGPLSRIDFELEDGELDTLAVIEAGASQTSQSSSAAWRGCCDIVGDKHIHPETALIFNIVV